MNETVQPQKRKRKGGLIAVIIVLGLIVAGIVGAVSSSKNNPLGANEETPIVFDAMVYAVVDKKNSSEAELYSR